MKKKMTITIVGAVTSGETFWEQFARFNQATGAYIRESFPDFQPIHPVITVTVDNLSRDDIIVTPPDSEAKL